MKSNFHEMTPSEFPWEREGLDYIRDGLPDHSPYEAWSNFEFLDDHGNLHEVDLLVVTPVGFFLVELKGHPAELHGDTSTWIWTFPDGRRKTVDNPLQLANDKAKRLKSLLERQKSFNKVSCPFLEPVVFLSSELAVNHLSGLARQRIVGRDGDEKPGILSVLKFRDGTGIKANVPGVNKPVAKAIAQAMEQAGIRPTQRHRKVGDYLLQELLFQCPKGTYQDWSARHVNLEKTLRRVRIYSVSRHESPKTCQLLQQAAEREFKLLEQLDHEGILRAETFTLHELGPALLFRHDPEAMRLDHFLASHGGRLGIDTKLSLLRQLADALRYAHGKGIVHRVLSPQSVLVHDPEGANPRIRIFNWQLARQQLSSGTQSIRHSFSIHPEQLVEDISLVYVAPESLSDPEQVDVSADLFSLGAIAYHLFSGRPPAATLKELFPRLHKEKGLNLAAATDGAVQSLVDLILVSTHPQVTARLDSAADFLDLLEAVEEELTAPPQDEVAENPLDAHAGELIEGGFKVVRNLGAGGSSKVYLVEQGGKEMVLKIAKLPEYASRLEAEYRVLDRLHHPLIVEVHGLHQIGEYKGITLQRAGNETLARYLQRDGRVQYEFLERFGSDLLDALKHLEDEGIYHRDIKPENIGIGPRKGKGKHRLILFDFSLSSTPLDNTRAGTLKYKDPFLDLPVSRKYDSYAERFSAALTLYEMATGTPPAWGDGKSDPALLDEEATLQPELFDTGLRGPMVAFFEKAFRRDYRKRHDNAEEMRKSWHAAFEKGESSHSASHHPPDFDPTAAVEQADLQTQLITLGLSARASNAMDRLNLVTVEQLLRFPIFKFYRLRGVGLKTRKEVTELARKLHRRFPEIPVDPDLAEAPVHGKSKPQARDGEPEVAPPAPQLDTLSVDALCREVLPRHAQGETRAGDAILLSFLGFDTGDTDGWPSQTEVAKRHKLTRARIGQVVVKSRELWRRLPALTKVRDDLTHYLHEFGGVMSVGDLAQALLAARGSAAPDTQRDRQARAVLRAALEAERGNQEPRFGDYRSGDRVLISLDSERVRHAEAIGAAADKLAAADPLLPPAQSLESLRALPAPVELTFSDNDLLRLSAYMSAGACLSSRLELYPRGMSALRALRLSTGALAGAQRMSVDLVHERVRNRYPEAETLPGRPDLDSLLLEVGLDLLWQDDPDGGYYRYRHVETFTLSSGSYGTRTAPTEIGAGRPASDSAARLFEQKLKRAAKEGAFLVLTVDPRHLDQAERQLPACFDLSLCNFDRLAIPALRQLAGRKKIQWDVVLRADATPPDNPDWNRLKRLFALCAQELEPHFQEKDRTILLTQPGLLARYQQMNLLERLRDRVGSGGNPLHGLWILLPEEGGPLPTLHGQPVPLIGSGQHARVPNSWLKKIEEVTT